MKMTSTVFTAILCVLSLHAALPAAHAQGGPDMATTINAQKEALKSLSFMDGEWRGTAWTMMRDGKRAEVIQTERIGSLLDGSIKLIEGRGYRADGTTGFNAFAVLSYDPVAKNWKLTSWAQGRQGEFKLTPTADGYVWSIPAGPTATIRYTAVFKGDTFKEIGEYLAEGQPARQTFEMNLTRVAPSTWPAAGAVSPQ
ncbi:MAG: DUF1579 domain-containing protein [Rhodoferax sp.]|nr:DUF1579 domain-containing protein [Rhodoferax sp.]